MKITRHNYEQFVIDYIEGTLSADMRQEMIAFLLQHPDISEEVEGVMAMPDLNDEDASMLMPDSFKASLKKKQFTPSSLSIEEPILLDYAEGDLSQAEKLQVESQLQDYPDFKAKLQQFPKLHLEADLRALYPDKESLKKRAAILPLWANVVMRRSMGIAAMLALVLYSLNTPSLWTDQAGEGLAQQGDSIVEEFISNPTAMNTNKFEGSTGDISSVQIKSAVEVGNTNTDVFTELPLKTRSVQLETLSSPIAKYAVNKVQNSGMNNVGRSDRLIHQVNNATTVFTKSNDGANPSRTAINTVPKARTVASVATLNKREAKQVLNTESLVFTVHETKTVIPPEIADVAPTTDEDQGTWNTIKENIIPVRAREEKTVLASISNALLPEILNNHSLDEAEITISIPVNPKRFPLISKLIKRSQS